LRSIFRVLLIILLVCKASFAFNQIIVARSGHELAGDILQLTLPGLAILSTFVHPDENYSAVINVTKTMLTAAALTHSLKLSINKTRPNGGDYSFPSGHTAASFVGAAFFHKRYGFKYAIPGYILAGYAGWSRIYANRHDYWDVLGGSVIGVTSAFLFTKRYQKKQKVNFDLGYTPNFTTIQLSYRF
jgi:membrane-associated phospholipid phosphatase